MSRRNGAPDRPDPDEQQRRQEETQLLAAGAESAAREHETAQSIHESFLEDLLDTSELEDPSKELLSNLISKNFMLANLNDAQANEIKYKLEIRKRMFFDAHPRPESGISGGTRAYVNDDPADTLKPLTQEQRLAVVELFDALWMNVTRSHDMKQQEILQTSITESYVQRGDDESDDKSGLLDYLPGVGG